MARGSSKSDAFDVKSAIADYKKQEASGEAFSRKNSTYVGTKDMPEAMNLEVKVKVGREVAKRVYDEMIRDHNKLKQVFLSNSVNRKDGTSSTFSPVGTPARLKLKKDVEDLARTVRRLRGAMRPELDGTEASKLEVPFTYAQRDKWENGSKKGSSKSDVSGYLEEDRKPLFDPSQGIGGGAYEVGQRLKADLARGGDTGQVPERRKYDGDIGEKPYSPDELREAKAKQKLAGQGGLYEGPGEVERRNERIRATEAANARSRFEGSLNDVFKNPYKPKKRK